MLVSPSNPTQATLSSQKVMNQCGKSVKSYLVVSSSFVAQWATKPQTALAMFLYIFLNLIHLIKLPLISN